MYFVNQSFSCLHHVYTSMWTLLVLTKRLHVVGYVAFRLKRPRCTKLTCVIALIVYKHNNIVLLS